MKHRKVRKPTSPTRGIGLKSMYHCTSMATSLISRSPYGPVSTRNMTRGELRRAIGLKIAFTTKFCCSTCCGVWVIGEAAQTIVRVSARQKTSLKCPRCFVTLELESLSQCMSATCPAMPVQTTLGSTATCDERPCMISNRAYLRLDACHGCKCIALESLRPRPSEACSGIQNKGCPEPC